MPGILSSRVLSIFCLLIMAIPCVPSIPAQADLTHELQSRNSPNDLSEVTRLEMNSVLTNPRVQDLVSTELSSRLFRQRVLIQENGIRYVIDSAGSEDLGETEDVQISSEIQKLAVDDLRKDPLKIFLYVYNEIGFIPYGWSLQGSAMTLSTGYGNDYDTASLLIALYRAAGIPARYVQGFVKVSPQRLANWVGAEDSMMPMWICNEANMIAVPNFAANGPLEDYSLVHCWVKAYIDGNWMELDPSFKEYKYYRKMDFNKTTLGVLKDMGAPNSSAALNEWFTSLEPDAHSRLMGQLKNAINSKIMSLPEDTLVKNVTGGQVIVSTDRYVSPPPPQDPRAKIESASLTPKDRYYVAVMFHATDPSSPDRFSQEIFYIFNASTVQLAGKRMTLSFVPATMKDHEIIEAKGGLLSAPCNLFMVRPALMIDGKPVLAGDPMKPGAGFPYKIVRYFPEWAAGKDPPQVLNRVVTSGSYSTISLHLGKLPLDAGKQIEAWNASFQQERVPLDDVMGGLLNVRALTFWSMMELYRASISQSYEVADCFKLPSVAQSAIMARKRVVNNVEYLYYDYPFMDVNIFFVNLPKKTVHPTKVTPQTDDSYARNDLKASAANSMYSVVLANLEAYIFYLLDDLPPTGALHQLLLADQRGIPIHFIAASNFREEITKLKYDDSTMWQLEQNIRKEVDARKLVIIPEKAVKDQILQVSIVNDPAKYTPKTYEIFGAAGYLTVAESGLWQSTTLATFEFNGGFPGASPKDGEGVPELAAADSFQSSKKTVQNQKVQQLKAGARWLDATKLKELTDKVVDVTDLVTWFLEKASFLRPLLKQRLGKLGFATTVAQFVMHDVSDALYYFQHSRANPLEKMTKLFFLGAAGFTIAGWNTPVSVIGGGLIGGGSKLWQQGFSKSFTPEGMKNAWNEAAKAAEGFSEDIDDNWKEFRRERYGPVFTRPDAPQHLLPPGMMILGNEDWSQSLVAAMDAKTAISGFTPIQTISSTRRGPHAWLISSDGLTAGSDTYGFETIVDMPYVFYENMTEDTVEFNVWNPRPDKDEAYSLAVSNQEDTAVTYQINVDLLSSSNQVKEKIELTLQKGEEALIPLRITSDPKTGDLTLVVEKPKPAYTVAFSVVSPVAGYMSDVFLDGRSLAPISAGAYRILVFDKGTKHAIRLSPATIRYENGTQIPLQPSTWEFTEGGTKRFQYGSSTPLTSQSRIAEYLPYFGVAAVVIVCGFLLVRRRRKPADARAIETSETAQARYCISCGAKINLGAKYCGECGQLRE